MGFEREAFDAMMDDVNVNAPIWDEMRRAGKGEPFVLRHLSKHGPCAPSQLAAALGVSSGRISAVLGALERKGYVERSIDPDDRRGIRVTLTAEGERRILHYRNEMRDRVCWVFSQMGERRSRELVDLIGEFATYMSLCRPGEPFPAPDRVAGAFEARARRRAGRGDAA